MRSSCPVLSSTRASLSSESGGGTALSLGEKNTYCGTFNTGEAPPHPPTHTLRLSSTTTTWSCLYGKMRVSVFSASVSQSSRDTMRSLNSAPVGSSIATTRAAYARDPCVYTCSWNSSAIPRRNASMPGRSFTRKCSAPSRTTVTCGGTAPGFRGRRSGSACSIVWSMSITRTRRRAAISASYSVRPADDASPLEIQTSWRLCRARTRGRGAWSLRTFLPQSAQSPPNITSWGQSLGGGIFCLVGRGETQRRTRERDREASRNGPLTEYHPSRNEGGIPVQLQFARTAATSAVFLPPPSLISLAFNEVQIL
eukprot:Rhum_TRINITY_DN13897_c0_g2::Rhum_TRINITY_DN13897_c0_g2_i1::g.65443::m.65443